MTSPRQHHFVPAWLLRRFAAEDGFVWWWSKDLNAGNVLKQKPEEVFCRRDLNARVLHDGTLDQSVEIELGILDDRVERITQELLKKGRVGEAPNLTVSEKRTLDEFLLVQFKRSPEWRTENMEREVFRELTGNELPSDVPKRIGANISPSLSSHARNLLQNDYVESILRHDPNVANVLGEKGLLLCRVPHGAALALGSSVVVPAGTGAGSLSEYHRGLAFPLASDIFLYVGNSKDVRMVCDLLAEEVDIINKQVAVHCHGIAGKSEDLIRSLIPSR